MGSQSAQCIRTDGDQEVLHSMFDNDIHRLQYINSLPNIFNWLRIQLIDNQDNVHKKVMHWTGIQRQIKNTGKDAKWLIESDT